ncbi:acyl carrier protein [Nocardia sp. CDC153]|uniref:acyl carrier protein n=1 Tax=Nocardia sp. CDC153 TaxID=3112167 RepID=UPI002DBFA762|nr:acyl carrier protein [Nocardia sp. CDC153]MEC3952020.1 acyl carrier protein [Nocardia sp. CDC153]
MKQFTLEDLRGIMRTSVGVEEGIDLDGDISDADFEDLGYDSLALLELTGEVQRQFGVVLPGDIVADMPTPRKAVEIINRLFAEAGV